MYLVNVDLHTKLKLSPNNLSSCLLKDRSDSALTNKFSFGYMDLEDHSDLQTPFQNYHKNNKETPLSTNSTENKISNNVINKTVLSNLQSNKNYFKKFSFSSQTKNKSNSMMQYTWTPNINENLPKESKKIQSSMLDYLEDKVCLFVHNILLIK